MNFRFNRVTGAPESRRCSVEGNVPRESSRRFQARQSRDCTLLQGQIACQIRLEAKSFRIKELSRLFSTRTVERVESVEKTGCRGSPLVNKKWRRKPKWLEKSAEEDESRQIAVLANVLRQLEVNELPERRPSGSPPLHC